MSDTHQDREGKLSPWLAQRRLRAISKHLRTEKCTIVDLACGSGQLREHLPQGARYWGVDRVDGWPDQNKDSKHNFLCLDLEDPNSLTTARESIDAPIDYVVLAAFIEHIPEPGAFLNRIKKELLLSSPGAAIIGTTPHPCGQRLHEILAKVGICSSEAVEEHEPFLDKVAIENAANESKSGLIHYSRFLFGLNQLFVIQ